VEEFVEVCIFAGGRGGGAMVEQIVQCCFSLFGGGHGRRREDGGGKCVGAWVVLVVETGREGMVVLIHGEDILGGFLRGGRFRPGPQRISRILISGKWSTR